MLKNLERRFALYGKARVWIEPVPGRLRRPPEIGATASLALSLLHRAGARPNWHAVRSPHLRNNALLGRGPSRLERAGSRLRGGVAEPAEVGSVAFAEVSRPQRHTGRERE